MKNDIVSLYRRRGLKRLAAMAFMAVFLAVAFSFSMGIGSSGISLYEAYSALMTKTGENSLIIWEIRLPRLIMAVIVGWGLAMGGAASQIALRNPLASPFTLGVSSGAAFGATVIIMSGALSPWLTAAAAFAGAVLTTAAVLGIAKAKGAGPGSIILAGVALMFLFSAMTSLLQYTATMQQVQAVVFWMFGSLANVGWPHIGVAFVLTIVPSLWLIRHSWDFNMMLEGDETAKAFGVNTERLRLMAMTAAALMCASSICFTGVIGFIGLVSPHIARMLLGSDHRALFPASALIGACVVISADTLGRFVWQPQVIPLGIMTSFIGVPFFLWLILRGNREAVR